LLRAGFPFLIRRDRQEIRIEICREKACVTHAPPR
jgi:hypothetical protein